MGRAIIIFNVDYSQGGLGKVTFLRHLESLDIVGASSVTSSYVYTVDYNPSNTSESGVVWSVESGNEYASIDQNGLLTALSGASASSVTIRATSVVNSLIYDEKTIEVTYVEELLNVHRTFNGTVNDVYETDYKLFSSGMTNWTLFAAVPDTAKDNTFRTAIQCMDETGDPYNGLVFHRSNNNSSYGGIGIDLNMTSNGKRSYNKRTRVFMTASNNNNASNRYSNNNPMVIGISRDGSDLYYTTDGEVWRKIDVSVVEIENNLVFGGYKDASGNYGRYYTSQGEYLDAILYPSSKANAGTFFTSHGINPSFYSLTDHTCDGTVDTAIKTDIQLFGSDYPNGFLMQCEFTLNTAPEASSKNATIIGSIDEQASSYPGVAITFTDYPKLHFNSNPNGSVVPDGDFNCTVGSRGLFSLRCKSGDSIFTANDMNMNGSTSSVLPSTTAVLTIGGALQYPDTWYSNHFIDATIHNLTIREL